MEGIRLNGTSGSYRQSTVSTTIDDGGRPVKVKAGDKVFCSFVGANREAQYFPEPDTVRIDRPMDTYIHYGFGPHACLGREASGTALTAMLRVVGRLDNLRRAPGPQGQLKKIPRPGGFHVYMRADHGSYFPFPTSEWTPHPVNRVPHANGFDSDESQLGWRPTAPQEDAIQLIYSGVNCKANILSFQAIRPFALAFPLDTRSPIGQSTEIFFLVLVYSAMHALAFSPCKNRLYVGPWSECI